MTHLEIAVSLGEFRAKTGWTEDANQTEMERSADSSKTATLIFIFFPQHFPYADWLQEYLNRDVTFMTLYQLWKYAS